MTLDGFIARPNGEIDPAFQYAADETIPGLMAEIGAFVIGNSGRISEEALPYGGQVKVT